MKRMFRLILILLFAVACGGSSTEARAQSRRVRRSEPPKDERTGKSEPSEDGAKAETKDETKAGDDKPVTAGETTVRAVIRAKPDPLYPRGARRYRVQGEVKLRIILGADGKVREEMDVLEGLPYGVTEEAIRAARRIEFEPARKNGRPVSQYVTVIYHFNLH
ncbi:MAG TPA: energy transducer TonB [Pyrinomonadaceae bacterium]|nr:energy transducer TonB [Pyrinomonadaceae bacterium]